MGLGNMNTTTETIIKAKDKVCDFKGCKNKGFRFIVVDMDLPKICYCEKHLLLWEMRIFEELNKK
jgi:hypothetical protein